MLIFYRAYWRTFCKAQLVELTKNFDEIESRNTVVFAISTHDLTNATSVAGSACVQFQILYNPSGDVVKQYEVFNLLRATCRRHRHSVSTVSA